MSDSKLAEMLKICGNKLWVVFFGNIQPGIPLLYCDVKVLSLGEHSSHPNSVNQWYTHMFSYIYHMSIQYLPNLCVGCPRCNLFAMLFYQ